MPVYASSPEFDSALHLFKSACAAESHAVHCLLEAMQGGTKAETLTMLSETMERAGEEKMRLLQEMKKFQIGA